MQKSVYLTFLISSLDIVLLYSWEIRDIHILKVDSRCQIFMRTTIHYAMKALWQHWLWSFNFRKNISSCVTLLWDRKSCAIQIHVVNIWIMRILSLILYFFSTYNRLHLVQFSQSLSNGGIFIGYTAASSLYWDL